MTIKTRQPSGKPPWPILLIAGMEKAGKTYAAAEASGSDLVGRTFWFALGEDEPDEYKPLGRFEIVEYDGTYRSLVSTLSEAVKEPAKAKGKPNLIVLDSGTRLWNLLSDMAQAEANRRWANRDSNRGKQLPDEGVQITMDLWNIAKSRWQNILDLLREHQGPSIITARLEQTTIVDGNGNPTKDKAWKVQAEKSLPNDAGVIVELHSRGEAYLTGVRSLRFITEQHRTEYPDFKVDDLWRKLGLAEGSGTRQHVSSTGEESLEADDKLAADRQALLGEIRKALADDDKRVAAVAKEWTAEHGHPITATTDLGALELLRDDLAGKAKEKAA